MTGLPYKPPYNFDPDGNGGPIDDPTDITGCVLWLDASDIATLWQTTDTQPDNNGSNPITVDGQTVANWDDKSGDTNNVAQSGAGSEPTYKTGIQNGKSILRFIDNAQVNDDFLFRTLSVLSQVANVTVFIVAAATSDETLGVIYSNTNTSDLRIAAYCDSRTVQRRGAVLNDSSGDNYANLPSDIGTEFNLITTIVDDPTITARLNGLPGSTTTFAGDGATDNDYTRIGNQFSEFTRFYGDLAMVAVYDRTLTDTEIDSFEVWAQSVWATPALP